MSRIRRKGEEREQEDGKRRKRKMKEGRGGKRTDGRKER